MSEGDRFIFEGKLVYDTKTKAWMTLSFFKAVAVARWWRVKEQDK